MDSKILSRIIDELKPEYNGISFQEYCIDAGVPLSQLADSFADDCLCVFWIATHEALKDEKYPRHYISVLQHRSIYSEFPKFITLFPSEVIGNPPELPPYLATYAPLLEDEKFKERVEKTYNRLEKKFNKNDTE